MPLRDRSWRRAAPCSSARAASISAIIHGRTFTRTPWRGSNQCSSRLRSRGIMGTFSSRMAESLSDRLAGTVPRSGAGAEIKESRVEAIEGYVRHSLPLLSVRDLLPIVFGGRSINAEPCYTDWIIIVKAHVSRIICFLLTAATMPAHACDPSDFSGMEGWTIAAVTQVRGDFEGCDFDRVIGFDSGWTLTCSEYSYSYSYRPDAVIFAKTMQFRGRSYWMIKALIDDEFYDMQPIPAK